MTIRKALSEDQPSRQNLGQDTQIVVLSAKDEIRENERGLTRTRSCLSTVSTRALPLLDGSSSHAYNKLRDGGSSSSPESFVPPSLWWTKSHWDTTRDLSAFVAGSQLAH